MYYFGTYEQCKAYDEQVTQQEKYVHNDNWANPIEIENVWYILKHKNYKCNLPTIDELPKQQEEI